MAIRALVCQLPMPHWQCPSCGNRVPRLLPNGQRNAVWFKQQEACLPGAHHLLASTGAQSFSICLSCADVFQELLGTLVVPEWQQGSLFEGPGVADTAIIAAITLVSHAEEAQILIATFTEQDYVLQEQCSLSAFDTERLTYPSEQGGIALPLWQRYQAWLRILRERYPNEEDHGK